MKKFLLLFAGAFLATSARCASTVQDDPWPSFVGVCEWSTTPDIVGVRLAVPFATRQKSVMGLDLGFWGEADRVEGIMVNLLRNDVRETFGGLQIGIYNTVNRCEFLAEQVGLKNEAREIDGFQVGLVNLAGDVCGFQIGLVNRAERTYGFQIGIVNVIRRRAMAPVFPVFNMGF